MKKKVHLYIFSFSIIFIVAIIGIAYSAFSQNLAINNITSSIRVVRNIRITDISVSNYSNGVVSMEDYNINNISTNIVLPNSDSYITYKIEITNIGNTEMGILNITGLPSNLEITPGIDEIKSNKICDSSNKCSLGIVSDLFLTIKYKNGMYNASNTTYDFALDFDFKESYSVNVTGIDNLDYPRSVLDTDNYILNIGDDIDVSKIKVLMGDNYTNNFTYFNGILTIPNVNGNLDISIEDDVNSYSVVVNGIDSSIPYSNTVREGSSFSVNIGSGYTNSDVFIRMGGNAVTNFTLQNGLLTVPNVTGNLNIGVVKASDVEFIIDESKPSATTTVNAPTLNDFITQSFDGYNTTNKNITSVTIEVVYSFNSGNTSQSINLTLSYEKDGEVITLPGPNEAAKTIPFNQKGNNIHKSVQFTGLSVPVNTSFTIKPVTNNISNGKPKVTQMILTAQFD